MYKINQESIFLQNASSMRTTCSRSTGAILKDVKDVINHRARHCIVQLVHTDRQRYTSVQIEQL